VFATVPNPVVYENTIFHVKVHCAADAPRVCEGDVTIRVKGEGDASGHYRVAPGATKKVIADSGLNLGKENDTVFVSLDPKGETGADDAPTPFVRRRLLVRQSDSGGGGGGGSQWPIKHVVRDKRGDSGNPLDLRKVEAHVRRGRLIMTWTCWNVVTRYKMSHDVANFHMSVYKREPGGPSRLSASVFYGDHGPVIFAGATLGPNDWGGRFYRPNRHAVRLSVPLKRFGRHIRQLWLQPATFGYHPGEDQVRDMIHFRV